jgi:hypothetical protein
LTATPKTSRVTLSCTESSVKAGSSKTITCTVHVKGYSPTGTVTWSQSGTGSVTFSLNTCTLTKGSCSIRMTGAIVGSVTIQAGYSGDPNNTISSATRIITIEQ